MKKEKPVKNTEVDSFEKPEKEVQDGSILNNRLMFLFLVGVPGILTIALFAFMVYGISRDFRSVWITLGLARDGEEAFSEDDSRSGNQSEEAGGEDDGEEETEIESFFSGVVSPEKYSVAVPEGKYWYVKDDGNLWHYDFNDRSRVKYSSGGIFEDANHLALSPNSSQVAFHTCSELVVYSLSDKAVEYEYDIGGDEYCDSFGRIEWADNNRVLFQYNNKLIMLDLSVSDYDMELTILAEDIASEIGYVDPYGISENQSVYSDTTYFYDLENNRVLYIGDVVRAIDLDTLDNKTYYRAVSGDSIVPSPQYPNCYIIDGEGLLCDRNEEPGYREYSYEYFYSRDEMLNSGDLILGYSYDGETSLYDTQGRVYKSLQPYLETARCKGFDVAGASFWGSISVEYSYLLGEDYCYTEDCSYPDCPVIAFSCELFLLNPFSGDRIYLDAAVTQGFYSDD